MFDKHTVEIDWAGRPLKLETGGMARQADGAVLASYGDTVLLATAVSYTHLTLPTILLV